MTDTVVRVAAIDCGTNTIRLLVSDVHGGGKTDLVRTMRVVRLGQGVDTSGHLSAEAIARTMTVTAEYADLIRGLDGRRVRFCATSAVRDADNAEAFADAVEGALGVRPVVLTGPQEARASFLGATRDLEPVRTLVVDIGGGSTEIVLGTAGEVEWSTSLDVGSVRLTERFLRGDPPATSEIAECTQHLDAVLAPVATDLRPAAAFVGVAGTVTTVAAHALGLSSYDSARIHLARLSLDDVRMACRSLLHMSVADRRALPFMHPGRADVIGAGALILERVIERVLLDTDALVVSEHDILDGIIWDMAAGA